MPDIYSWIETIRQTYKIKTRTPGWSVVSFVLCNENGVVAAVADRITGALTSPGGIAFATKQVTQTAYTASGAVAIASGTAVISVAGVGAMTLAAPTTAQNGIRMVISSTTANAHTVTATSLINDGATGVPHTTATFAAFAGASIEIEAYNGLWQVIANNHVTVS